MPTQKGTLRRGRFGSRPFSDNYMIALQMMGKPSWHATSQHVQNATVQQVARFAADSRIAKGLQQKRSCVQPWLIV